MLGHGDHCHHGDHYENKTAAEMAARQMGLSGAHKMTCNGTEKWMPGESHDAYREAKPTFAGDY